MKNRQQKLEHLKWLNSIGVEYYFSAQKDSKNCFIKSIKEEAKGTDKKLFSKPRQSVNISLPIKQELPMNNKPEPSSRTIADKAGTIEELYKNVENFDGCELKSFARNTVFSDGIRGAPILIVGEAPGATEDMKAIPFCGESGKLLDAMLDAIGLSRERNVYITNTVFWRPPANRRPTNEEIEMCRPFVEKHIALADPKLMILVGSTAATSLIGRNEGISYIRNNNYEYTNRYLTKPIVTTALFHPAYLLRQPMQKKATWFDLLNIEKLIKNMGIL